MYLVYPLYSQHTQHIDPSIAIDVAMHILFAIRPQTLTYCYTSNMAYRVESRGM